MATDISRRTFIKATVVGGVSASALGFDLRQAQAAVRQLKIQNAKEYRTVCPTVRSVVAPSRTCTVVVV